MEWQAWHFRKTRRPAAASPLVGVVVEAGEGAADAGGAGDWPVVALGDGVLFAAMWSTIM